ncbi:MAG: RNA methyltransferase [Oscillospiraceae bacterium]|nr:RNA methyltransferase [Oscillospiraceae bacterium]
MSEIISRRNALIKQFRFPGDFIVVEGVKLISEALDCGFVPKASLLTEKAIKKYSQLYTRLYGTVSVITDAIAEYISDTSTPQGVFAMFGRKELYPDYKSSAHIMLLDCIQDPGNVGAIIRSCEAFGFGGVFLSEDSADIYNPKVIRASAGSVFRQPTHKEKLTTVIPLLRKAGYALYSSAIDKNAVSLREIDFSGKSAIVIGNEGAGVSQEVSDLCDRSLYIPIQGAESLNAGVAAGIICYEIKRKSNFVL